VARPSPTALPRESLRWTAMAASLIVAVGIGWLGGDYAGQRSRMSDELLAGYMRVAVAERPVDVESSDRHTVKPWFAGRIDYSPPVHDLTADGYPLAGGRLDVVDGRKVSVLVYRRNQHKVAFTLWPAGGGDSSPKMTLRDGFAMAEWRHGGFAMHAVSDISPDEMTAFATAMNKALDADK
jgi:anti-sigma factor RsiW